MKKRLARKLRSLQRGALNKQPRTEAAQKEGSVFAAKAAETQAAQKDQETIAQLNDKYLRLRADFENYRRRMAKEALEIREKANQQTVSEFLNVHDYLVMALENFGTGAELEKSRQGVEMILNEFNRLFEGLGVKRLDAVGQDFDPNLHEAVGREESSEVPEGKVLRQWKAGFQMNGKLLRPATVVVAVAPAAKTEEKPQATEEGK